MTYPKPDRTAAGIVCGLIGSAVGPVLMLARGPMIAVGGFITVVSTIVFLIGLGNLIGAVDHALQDRWAQARERDRREALEEFVASEDPTEPEPNAASKDVSPTA